MSKIILYKFAPLNIQDIVDQMRIEREIAEEKKEAAFKNKINRGPPLAGVTKSNWEMWIRERRFLCPSFEEDSFCRAKSCVFGLYCRDSAARGLLGNGRAYPKAERPRCEARTRQGFQCQMAIVAGKTRCRLHGGLSTGPKTGEGRERIAEAQRKRWAEARLRKSATTGSRE